MVASCSISLASACKSPSGLTERNNLQATILCNRISQRLNAGADAKENGAGLDPCRMPQLASIPKTKRQAARQPTDNGTDEASNERKPRQRPASRCWDSADVLVHRVTHTNVLSYFKRLIPYSKQVGMALGARPEGIALLSLACRKAKVLL